MLSKHLLWLFERDLAHLKQEISHYKSDETIWLQPEGTNNSAGNLCLHLVGNLQHFIGATLGHTDYVRNREAEFSTKNLSKEELLALIEGTLKMVKETLPTLSEDDLIKDYPIQVFFGKTLSIGEILIAFASHFSYHLGQINYHRRLLDK